ncbi:hypothetical protein BJ138DRAFT_1080985 [Hygrophoropsis aurantiaca]|uniref:Uncharacterized protein n=1 Tax=Hygrophoropsis aurantiaca TaxID=72124 RepID=A0ACB8AL54_9AGAM|nr:hypothetical protein BJ138DRAFT_1080985 [Hygrophoropsis aurantiaca]
MVGWRKTTTTSGECVYSRPLGVTELGFFWDSELNGTADSVQHLRMRVLQKGDEAIYSDQNVIRTWLSLKQRFPMLGCQVERQSGAIEFAVRQKRLTALTSEDLTFKDIASAEEGDQMVQDLLQGPRPLNDDMLARIYILRRTDRSDYFHVIFFIAHCITDGASNSSIQRSFFHTLSSQFDNPVPELESRLSMVPSSDELAPTRHLSTARKRWRQAIGFAIYSIRATKMQGGHTLPRKFTAATYRTPARSALIFTVLTPEQTNTVVVNCRQNNITLGNAILALSQVAMTRVLYRRYLRGEISPEEWEHRKKQPMHSGGPINLRPFLDTQWYNRGGGGDVFLAISFFMYTMPFMTLGSTERDPQTLLKLVDGAPPFSALLPFKRFILRSHMVQAQAQRYLRHPLFLEIAIWPHITRIERTRLATIEWKQPVVGGQLSGSDENISPMDQKGPISAHGGSSIGNLDSIIPLEYPMPSSNPLSPSANTIHPAKAGFPPRTSNHPTDSTPRLFVEQARTHLHCRPAELYLGVATSRKLLHLSVFWDENVYDRALVQEWLGEVKDATLYYLGQSHWEEKQYNARL